MSALGVVVDGIALPDDEARAFWKRFSTWMDEHPGDLGGFARSEGLSSVHPEMQGGSPVLVASRTAAQGAYTTAPKRPASGGSAAVHGGPGRPGKPAAGGGSAARKPKKKRG
jgi:hypothetical protein